MPRHDGIALPPIYLNGLCESTHGFGDAGSFSLLALRSSTIARSVSEAISLPRVDDVAAFQHVHQAERVSDVRRAR
jgi:lysine/ornithine N-monooxygenase